MSDKRRSGFRKRFILDFHEIPGEMFDEVNGIKINRYLNMRDTEETELYSDIVNSADFSDGDEPDDITGVEDFDEIEDYVCFDDIIDSLELEEDEDLISLDCFNFDIEYFEIAIN